jgi:hypothetical protein
MASREFRCRERGADPEPRQDDKCKSRSHVCASRIKREEELVMNSQERQVIADIFQRLEQVADQPRDPEAERFIADKIRQQPYAPYAMAQALYVQEQALTNLHAQVRQLEDELERLHSQPRQSGGLLASLFGGGGGREPEPRRPMGSPFGQPPGGPYGGPGGQAGPWGGQPGMMGGQPGMFGGGPFGGQRGGSGFLGTAMMTAAGVAGGMMLGNALASAFGGAGGHGGQGLFGGGDSAQANAGGQDHSDLSPFQNAQSGGFQDASYDGGQDADFGGDFGGDGGGDWS